MTSLLIKDHPINAHPINAQGATILQAIKYSLVFIVLTIAYLELSTEMLVVSGIFLAMAAIFYQRVQSISSTPVNNSLHSNYKKFYDGGSYRHEMTAPNKSQKIKVSFDGGSFTEEK